MRTIYLYLVGKAALLLQGEDNIFIFIYIYIRGVTTFPLDVDHYFTHMSCHFIIGFTTLEMYELLV